MGDFPMEALDFILLCMLLLAPPFRLDAVYKDTPIFDIALLLRVINFLVVSFRIMNMCRATESRGKNIIAVMETTFSGSVIQMLFLAVFFEIAVLCAVAPLLPTQTFDFLFLYLHRSLLFGDGDALDKIKLDTDSSWPMNTVMIWSSFCFNIMILNVIIAVYCNEYERNVLSAATKFGRRRAKLNCRYHHMLSWLLALLQWMTQKVPGKVMLIRRLPLVMGMLLFAMGILSAFASFAGPFLCTPLLFFGQFFLCIWGSGRGLKSLEKDHTKRRYLWYAYPATSLGVFEAGRKAQDKDLDNLLKPDCFDVLSEHVHKKFGRLRRIVKGMSDTLERKQGA